MRASVGKAIRKAIAETIGDAATVTEAAMNLGEHHVGQCVRCHGPLMQEAVLSGDGVRWHPAQHEEPCETRDVLHPAVCAEWARMTIAAKEAWIGRVEAIRAVTT